MSSVEKNTSYHKKIIEISTEQPEIVEYCNTHNYTIEHVSILISEQESLTKLYHNLRSIVYNWVGNYCHSIGLKSWKFSILERLWTFSTNSIQRFQRIMNLPYYHGSLLTDNDYCPTWKIQFFLGNIDNSLPSDVYQLPEFNKFYYQEHTKPAQYLINSPIFPILYNLNKNYFDNLYSV